MQSESVQMWRCFACGKWSHAKRRPSEHQRFERDKDEYGETVGSREIVCGPFERFVAVKEDPDPPFYAADYYGRVKERQYWGPDLNAGIEVPF